MSEPSSLQRLLAAVASGERTVENAVHELTNLGRHAPTVPPKIDRVNLDLDRQKRCGFPEVIYGEGKPAEMIVSIISAQRAAGQPSLATRVTEDVAAEVCSQISDARYSPLAKTLRRLDTDSAPLPIPDDQSDSICHVALVTAGSTDAPVGAEAAETLHWMGVPFRQVDDIGVAGPQRLLAAVPLLRKATAVVVIAGMEGALPAALGGHLEAPVFAVPTSVGYGASLGGMTALFGMLSSCASNVAVVNIDAGFKAAYLSGLVWKQVTQER